jgi:beta-glucanase (GH16 family)
MGVSVGSAHYSTTLPFDAGESFHRYDMLWGNGTAEFFADGTPLTLTPPLNPSDVPTVAMDIMINT